MKNAGFSKKILSALIAVFDMLRAGRIRERKFAESRLQEMFA